MNMRELTSIPSEIFKGFLMNLSELIDFYSPWNHQKTIGFLMISGGIEVN